MESTSQKQTKISCPLRLRPILIMYIEQMATFKHLEILSPYSHKQKKYTIVVTCAFAICATRDA